ncbi:TRAP transporter small permease [Magnetospira sp. QH-2]|uniref:TRAP transporter small permease n=1 Tax=Magnetospira sp. (strain QH-2) TaxID=1288970 RepID=UPI0003E80FA8|nr:TRAP transporter small permease [Magnetospira sp. QH-2]CCQ74941.1 TRAP dicarboxylate transporter, DctQ component [Magnetospira sp. QH-2]
MAAERPLSSFHRALDRLSGLFALGGGMLLVAVGLMTVVSIVGRWLFFVPVPGDFELMQNGCAVAIFTFLPHAQMRRGHVAVDLFTRSLPPSIQKGVEAIGFGIFTLIAALLTWRLSLGGLSFLTSGETSMILGLPLWWSFPPIVASCALLTLCCLSDLIGSLRR